jgi:bifunctional UDP-N-acetylglucosamine pyrophosphorylase / glucosamine-1-phosphate N-acetyltransferase
MRSRLLIVPAAGLGTRLGASLPKLLVPVAGMPMIDRLLALFAGAVGRALVVVHPSFEREVQQHLDVSARGRLDGSAVSVTTVVQPRPTGMLDAIMLAEPTVHEVEPDEIWVTWCDQVAIHPATIRRLAELTAARPDAALIMPTVSRRNPYIHLHRDGTGRIVEILHGREGDVMPEMGESDMGLFAFPRASFAELLPQYARDVAVGTTTGERNFLPFIAWASSEHEVVTFPAFDEMEAVGVNTPEELRVVEDYLATRESRPS